MSKKSVASFKTSKIKKEYFLKTVAEVLKMLKSKEKGLNLLEVRERRSIYGTNEIIVAEKMSQLKKFLLRFKSPLIIILFVIGTTSLTVAHDVRSAVVIYAMIILSIVTDFIQEYKSEKAVEKLKEKVISTVEVLRDGKRGMIKASELVPGDVVLLSVGTIVPADARVISSDDFFVNESTLTGEAFPVEKNNVPLADANVDINSQKNIVFMGTNVVSGYASVVIIATGANTVYGRIASKMGEPSQETEFEKGVRSFGSLIVKVVVALVALIFILNTGITHHPWLDSLMFSLALAVGLTPELLPMIMSITLAKGSVNMAKQGVIVKRLNSIHDFGGMDVLCTDKTGTLTENRIEMVKHIDIAGRISELLLDYTYLNSTYQSGLANPLDEAVLKVNEPMDVNLYKKIDEIPFDFQRRRLSVIVEVGDKRILVTKGAPEEMWPACLHYADLAQEKTFDQAALAQAQAKYNELSADGYRVLAVAYKNLPIEKDKTEYSVADESGLVLMGLIAFLDPPKVSARQAIEMLEGQGIEIKIVTGDNELVTRKICTELDINIKGILTGIQIGEMDDAALQTAVENTTIFSRVSPEQKGRIVSMLRLNKHSVGYMGDGINDALPLKAADVGISVNNAVDVAKEAADLILLTKDLNVLSLGVTEGRKTFRNTMKYILMGLSSNFGNMFSVAAASFLLPFLPMLPVQILLNNMMYDLSQVTIPLDNVDAENVAKPKRWDLKFIYKFMFLFGPISSIFDILTFVVMLQLFKVTTANAGLFQAAWFMESFATQTLVIFFIRTKQLPFVQSRPGKWLAATILLFVVISAIIPLTAVGRNYFGFISPGIGVYAAVWFLVVVYLVMVELVKRPIYKKYF